MYNTQDKIFQGYPQGSPSPDVVRLCQIPTFFRYFKCYM